MNCSAQQPLVNKVIYLGHDLEAGQMLTLSIWLRRSNVNAVKR